MDKKQTKGLILILSTALISGVSIFVNGLFVSKVTPSIFTFLKNGLTAFAIAGLIIGAHLLTKHKSEIFKLNLKQWGQLALIGLIGGSVPFLLFFNGLAETGAAAGSLIHKAMFLFVMVLAPLTLKEKTNHWILPLAILLLIANQLLLGTGITNFGTGHIMILGATMLWAIENLISKKVLQKLSGSVVAFGRMFFGAIFIFTYLLLTEQSGSILTLTADQWILTLTATLFLIGYVMTWYNGLKTVPVTLATVILLLGSPITTLLSMVFLQKEITLAQGTGILLTFAGVTAWIFITRPWVKTTNINQPSRKYIRSES